MLSKQDAFIIATECVQELINRGDISQAINVKFKPAKVIWAEYAGKSRRFDLPNMWCVYYKNLKYTPDETDTEEEWIVMVNAETGEIINKDRIGGDFF